MAVVKRKLKTVMKVTNPCWVNIFTAPYADTVDGSRYYISMAYKSEKLALESIPSYMKERYIKTINLQDESCKPDKTQTIIKQSNEQTIEN